MGQSMIRRCAGSTPTRMSRHCVRARGQSSHEFSGQPHAVSSRPLCGREAASSSPLGCRGGGFSGCLYPLQRMSEPLPARDHRGGFRGVSGGRFFARRMHVLRGLHFLLRTRCAVPGGTDKRRAALEPAGTLHQGLPEPFRRGLPQLRRPLRYRGDPLSPPSGRGIPAAVGGGALQRLRSLCGPLSRRRGRCPLEGGKAPEPMTHVQQSIERNRP